VLYAAAAAAFIGLERRERQRLAVGAA
jgi:hypothetical protein